MSTDTLTSSSSHELDKEASSGSRHLSGIYLKLTAILAIVISLYAIYSNALSNTQEFYRNATFLGGILILGFILFPPFQTLCHPKIQSLELSFYPADIAQLWLFLFHLR
ncbi:TRAP transporter, 4TM/12TM fusion protein (fragment) [Xenorhabdus bovienii str. oregonense]|uniref:TRAP transporter, 4TM/12TM fusion protein n=1 Tax=Xenorhabdus bovienii str. oregonense TaxID=1398202 RepID=A0A077P481_XENBV